MAAKKRKTKPIRLVVPAFVKRLVAVLVGPARSLAIGLLAVAVVAVGCYLLWQRVRGDVLASDQYQVTAESLEITPLPEWIRTDPRRQVFNSLALGGPLSIMDENAARRVADAFRVHPWVDRVIQVTKRHPSRIRVELKYRRPVCMVQVEREPAKAMAVDVRGVWLPDDFESADAERYPLLVNVDSKPLAGYGMPWGDERVVAAAEIAEAFGGTWQN